MDDMKFTTAEDILKPEVTYEIEQHGDSFVLYSIIEKPFEGVSGVTKNYVRRAQTAGELAATIRRLQNAN